MSRFIAAPWLIAAVLLSVPVCSEAQTYVFVGGRWVRTGSIDCLWTVGSVPSTTTFPAKAECVVTVTTIDVLCENPTNHQVSPGSAATKSKFSAEGWLNNLDGLTKSRGVAPATLAIDTNIVLTAQQLQEVYKASCVNPNWWPIQGMVRTIEAVFNNYRCPKRDETCPLASATLCSTTILDCRLPAEYTLSNPPAEGAEIALTCTERAGYPRYFCGL